MDSQESDIIRLSDIVIVFMKRFKLWLALFIIGLICSIVMAVMHTNKYQYSAIVDSPRYINYVQNGSNGSITSILDNNQLQNLLTLGYNGFMSNTSSDELANDLSLDSDKKNIGISIVTAKGQQQKVRAVFEDFLNSPLLKKQVSAAVDAWKNSLLLQKENAQNSLNQLTSQIHELQQQLKQLNSVDKTTSLSSSIVQQISGYQSQIMENQSSIKLISAELASLIPDLSISGDQIVMAEKAKGLSTSLLGILGVLLSLFIATVVIFIAEAIVNIKKEVRQKLDDQA
ncbi:MAG: Wzz/FepE/Etk N-terminal domain-containing protein [Francisellaceae bacterium]